MSSRNLELALAGAPGVKVLPDLPATPAHVNDMVNVTTIDPDGTVRLGFLPVPPAAVMASDTPPVGVADNTLWWDSADTGLYIRSNDGNSTQWVSTNVGLSAQYLPVSGGTLEGKVTFLGQGEETGTLWRNTFDGTGIAALISPYSLGAPNGLMFCQTDSDGVPNVDLPDVQIGQSGTWPDTFTVNGTAHVYGRVTAANMAISGANDPDAVLTVTSTGGAWPAIKLNATKAGSSAGYIEGQRNGLRRWSIDMGSAAESGSNAGTNLAIGSFADDGSALGSVLDISRATRTVNLYAGLTMTLNTAKAGSGATGTPVTLRAGKGDGNGSGGTTNILGGDAGAGTGAAAGGGIFITAGSSNAAGTGAGGALGLSAGSSLGTAGAGGAVTVQSGSSKTKDGGNITITAGGNATAAGNGGSINFTTGAAFGSGKAVGGVNFGGGTAFSSATKGVFSVDCTTLIAQFYGLQTTDPGGLYNLWNSNGMVVMTGFNPAQLTIGASGAPTIRSGAGAATGTQPKGSLFMRTDGAVGSTLYVSQGAGVWNAVAGV